MWKIWIFLLLKIISALTINNEVITTSKSQASQSQDIIISPQGKYVFMQTPTITFSRNFENQGTFSVSTEQLQKLSLKFQYTSGKFLNKGTFTAITSDMAQATEFLIKVNQFTNEDNGYMKIESGSRSGTQNSLIEASSLKNKGIIIIKNQGVNRGTFQINLKTTSGIGGSWGSTKPAVEFSNAGTIELYFQNFKQGNWPIVGGGCIYLENKSLLELDTNNAANLQTFVFGEQSTIVINNSVKNFSFKFMNFAPGNIIQSKYLLRFSYRSDTGVLTLYYQKTTGTIVLGSGYDEGSFKIYQDGLRYTGKMPALSYPDCRIFPSGAIPHPEPEPEQIIPVDKEVPIDDGNNQEKEVPTGDGNNQEKEVPTGDGNGDGNNQEKEVPTDDGNKDENKVPTDDGNNQEKEVLTDDGNNQEKEVPTDDGNKDENKVPTDDADKDVITNKGESKIPNKDGDSKVSTDDAGSRVPIGDVGIQQSSEGNDSKIVGTDDNQSTIGDEDKKNTVDGNDKTGSIGSNNNSTSIVDGSGKGTTNADNNIEITGDNHDQSKVSPKPDEEKPVVNVSSGVPNVGELMIVDSSKPFKLFIIEGDRVNNLIVHHNGDLVVGDEESTSFVIGSSGELIADEKYFHVLEDGKIIMTSDVKDATRVWSLINGKLDLETAAVKSEHLQFFICNGYVYVGGESESCEVANVVGENFVDEQETSSELPTKYKQSITEDANPETEGRKYIITEMEYSIETSSLESSICSDSSDSDIISKKSTEIDVTSFRKTTMTSVGTYSSTGSGDEIIYTTITTDVTIVVTECDELETCSTVESIKKATIETSLNSVETATLKSYVEQKFSDFTNVAHIGGISTSVAEPDSNSITFTVPSAEVANGSDDGNFINKFAIVAMLVPLLWI